MDLGERLNCFEWQTHLSSFLDGELKGPIKASTEKHAQTCRTCKNRLEHYRLILSTISSGLSHGYTAELIPLKPNETGNRKSRRWDRTPWFIKSSMEGFGVAAIILLVVALAPRLRSIYESSLERQLDDYDLAELPTTEIVSSGAAAQSGSQEEVPTSADVSEVVETGLPTLGSNCRPDQDAVTGSSTNCAPGATSSDPKNQMNALLADPELRAPDKRPKAAREIRVGRNEIWRFNLKTVSPDEMKPKVLRALSKMGLPKDLEGLEGVQAPGGIQFNILVPSDYIAPMKEQFSGLAPEDRNFAWFKNRSRRNIPKGKTRVVIWISQI